MPANQDGKKRMNAPKAVIIGFLLGIMLFCVSLIAVDILLPTQKSHDSNLNYGYIYSGEKSQSVDFSTSSALDNSLFVFGSSELSTPNTVVSQVPSEVFGKNNYGINLVYVGEAYDQSLWHSMAIGAYASSLPKNSKIILILSPTWFEDAGLDEETFKMRFSYNLYRAFCDNSNISQSSKNYLAKRLSEYNIEQTMINAGLNKTLVDQLNNAIYLWAEDLKTRVSLVDVRKEGEVVCGNAPQEPDFDDLHHQALVDAAINSTNNAWGMDDGFYANSIEGRLDKLRNSQQGEKFANMEELQDFSFVLKVCNELELKPLVIIPPVHGEFYDHIGTSGEDRQRCYDRIIEVCQKHNVQYANFSNKEYEQYFLHDIVHLGNTGWVEAERAIFEFAKDK